jgi:hypothetical protein
MRSSLILWMLVATLIAQGSARAEDTDRLKSFVFADVLVRNGDILSGSIVAAREVALLSGSGATLAIGIRPRVGLGGASAALGLLGYVDCWSWARHLPCAGLNAQGVVLRSWWLSDWHPDTYAGGELGFEIYFVRFTAGVLKGLESGQIRFQVGIGLGV